ncbi:MAG: HD domain-containing protein [Candidatus Cloacimonadales bacterium]
MVKKYKQIEDKFFAEENLEVLYQLFKLKNLLRQGWLKRDISKLEGESVADHTFGTAMTAWVLAKHFELDLNMEKVLKMSLVHEIGEIYAGDITPVDGVSQTEKYDRELASIEKVFANYKGGAEFISLWKEFEEAESGEAIFLKQIDKFEMGIQAAIYKGHANPKMDEFIESATKVMDSPELQKLFKQVINREETK